MYLNALHNLQQYYLDHFTMNFLENKVVLLTGGSGVIGTKMLQELLKHNVKGVAIVDLHEESEAEKTIFIQADITKSEELEGAFKRTVEKYHQLDVVINNAGVMDEKNWRRAVAVNLSALIDSTHLAMKYLPDFKSTEEGTVVNIASLLGFDVLESIPVYCATKHGVVGLGKALGTQSYYEKYQVRLLTICPGPVDTPLITKVDDRFLFPEKMIQELETNKIQTPDNVATALIKVINEGQHGSFWVVEKNEPAYQVVPSTSDSLKLLS